MRIALGLEYDGRGFTGWQTQPGGTAVQNALERALAAFAEVPVPTICAGRTDAGVHASYQVVHIDPPVERPLSAWVRGVNAFLPATVAVRWSRAVPDAFHARFSATGRRYDYWLLNDPVRSPLADGRVGWLFRPLDEARCTPLRKHCSASMTSHPFAPPSARPAHRCANCGSSMCSASGG